LAQIRQPKLDGRTVTASFGVTEIQPGDTPETMLRRADRGLLAAKERGRNCVVQLGAGSGEDERDGWRGFWSRKPANAVVVKQDLHTPVPLKVAIEKLRGFVADHQAKILKTSGSHVQLELDDGNPSQLRRRSDRSVVFELNVRFEEERLENAERYGTSIGGVSHTRIRVTISPRKNRDRRRGDVEQRAREVLASFRSYLMAAQAPSTPRDSHSVLHRVSRVFTPWLTR
jgi:hypothetical protein